MSVLFSRCIVGYTLSSDIFWSAGQPANEAMIFHVVQSFAAANCRWNEKVSSRSLTMYFYSFVSITRHNFPSTYQIAVSKEFWRFFDAVRGFYINSSPESNSLLVVMTYAFPCHSYIIVAQETVSFNVLINLSGPLLTRESTLMSQYCLLNSLFNNATRSTYQHERAIWPMLRILLFSFRGPMGVHGMT